MTETLTAHLTKAATLGLAWQRADSKEQAEEILEDRAHEIRGAEIELDKALTPATMRVFDWFDYLHGQDDNSVEAVNRREFVAQRLATALMALDQALTVVAVVE